ncbi:MAG: hypothetical protein AAFW87_07305, partial [Pseudomonadota bacterium]
MGMLALLLLVGSTIGGLVSLGGLDAPDLDEAQSTDSPDGEEDMNRGADLLTGTNSEDLLSGGDGGDWILSYDGNDTISGNKGGDVLIGGDGVDVINAGPGNDFVEAANLVNEALLRTSATAGGDVLDVVFEYDLPGKSDAGDLVSLGDGEDTVVAGSDDTISGGAGADEFALGDWIDGGRPVEIEDFDVAEDIITFVYDRQGPEPELTVEANQTTGVTTIRADGEAIAVLRDASPEFSVKNIA